MGASRRQHYGHKLLFCGLLAVAVLLLVSNLPSATATATKPKPKPKAPVKLPSGTVKEAWPEYQGRVATEVAEELKASGLVKQVFIWPPSASRSGPFYPGKPEDVWLYTTGDDGIVYEIPRRGLWHFNRINPGWPELEGVDYKVAIKTILKDYTGVRVVYGPQGFPRTKDYRIDRVFLEYDKKTFKVVGVARAG